MPHPAAPDETRHGGGRPHSDVGQRERRVAVGSYCVALPAGLAVHRRPRRRAPGLRGLRARGSGRAGWSWARVDAHARGDASEQRLGELSRLDDRRVGVLRRVQLREPAEPLEERVVGGEEAEVRTRRAPRPWRRVWSGGTSRPDRRGRSIDLLKRTITTASGGSIRCSLSFAGIRKGRPRPVGGLSRCLSTLPSRGTGGNRTRE